MKYENAELEQILYLANACNILFTGTDSPKEFNPKDRALQARWVKPINKLRGKYKDQFEGIVTRVIKANQIMRGLEKHFSRDGVLDQKAFYDWQAGQEERKRIVNAGLGGFYIALSCKDSLLPDSEGAVPYVKLHSIGYLRMLEASIIDSLRRNISIADPPVTYETFWGLRYIAKKNSSGEVLRHEQKHIQDMFICDLKKMVFAELSAHLYENRGTQNANFGLKIDQERAAKIRGNLHKKLEKKIENCTDPTRLKMRYRGQLRKCELAFSVDNTLIKSADRRLQNESFEYNDSAIILSYVVALTKPQHLANVLNGIIDMDYIPDRRHVRNCGFGTYRVRPRRIMLNKLVRC